MKPLATLNRPVLETVDMATKESTVSFRERTDVTAVPAMGVVAETMTALVLASEALRKLGATRWPRCCAIETAISQRWPKPRRPRSGQRALRLLGPSDRSHLVGRHDGGRQDHGRLHLGRAPFLGLPRF